jgi:hypothetical protein
VYEGCVYVCMEIDHLKAACSASIISLYTAKALAPQLCPHVVYMHAMTMWQINVSKDAMMSSVIHHHAHHSNNRLNHDIYIHTQPTSSCISYSLHTYTTYFLYIHTCTTAVVIVAYTVNLHPVQIHTYCMSS